MEIMYPLLDDLCQIYQIEDHKISMESDITRVLPLFPKNFTETLINRIIIAYFYLKTRELNIYIPLRDLTNRIALNRRKSPAEHFDILKRFFQFRTTEISVDAFFRRAYSLPLNPRDHAIYEIFRQKVEKYHDPRLSNRERVGVLMILLHYHANLPIPPSMRHFLKQTKTNFEQFYQIARKIDSTESQTIT